MKILYILILIACGFDLYGALMGISSWFDEDRNFDDDVVNTIGYVFLLTPIVCCIVFCFEKINI